MEYAKRYALIETLKSIGRGLYFAILGLIGVALAALVSSGAITDVSITVAGHVINLAYVIIAVVGFIAKGIDTYVHKNENMDAAGIAPPFLQR